MQKLSLISLEPDPLPSFSEVMGEVESLMRLLYESLDVGATVCRKYYEQNCDGESPEPHLREMIVRDQAKRYLAKNGLRVTELKERRFRLAAEPLISLLVHYRGFAFRVLKGKKGVAPGCGTSTRRREFYNQASVRYLGDDGKPAGSKTNLLVLWDFSPGFGIANVWLACPQVAGARSQDVVLAWQEPVTNPILQPVASQRTPASAAQAETLADQEIEALLVGGDGPVATESDDSSQLDRDVPMDGETPTVSATHSEEEADDRQSDKVGA
ncbi:hypothetical protein [Edaphobacter sp. DSM 109919]|uniref:Uncharacterized protein n=1 Tax=Edaphobacter paludis TaxID=3035702 RepID=A0AAU7CTD5_9BACT